MQHVNRMGRVPVPAPALGLWLPLLVLPVVVFGIALLVWPQEDGARRDALLAAVVMALGWYGVALVTSSSRLWRSVLARRELLGLRAGLDQEEAPVWVTDSNNIVLFQNLVAAAGEGDRRGQRFDRLLRRHSADPEAVLAAMVGRAGDAGQARQRIDTLALTLDCHAQGELRLWRLVGHEQAPPAPRPATVASASVREPDAAVSFENLPVALVGVDADGSVSHSNRAARAILGEIEPKTHLADLLDGLGRPLSDWLSDVLTGRSEGRPEVLRARTDLNETYLQVSLSRDGRGGLVAVLSDATAMKTLEAQFVQSQKMQAIGQLAGGIAHDFNNLLTAITGHCDLLMLRHDKGDPDYADLDQISQNANRAAALVGQLLAFSRKQTLKPQVIDLRDTLADLTHLLNRLVGERITLTFEHDPALRPIRADRRQFEQVVMNLVVNARDAMPEGGEITIRTDNLFLDGGLARDSASIPPGEYVRVRVTDQGCGIPPEKLEKIFEPFYTTKRTGEGTGLGLSTAYGIVKQTGGYIFCDSKLACGTEFSLYFPAHDASQLVTAPSPLVGRRVPSGAATGVVLLVEDEAPVRSFARRALTLQGFDVIEADSAEAALEKLQDADLKVDVFVTDVVMPGMDGPTWVRRALQDRPGTRVVFVSGYTDDIFAEGRAPIENAVFLPKPFSLTELTALVQQQMDADD